MPRKTARSLLYMYAQQLFPLRLSIDLILSCYSSLCPSALLSDTTLRRKHLEGKMADGTEINAQGKSIFFSRPPQEIRDEIYRHVWSGTRLSFGSQIRPGSNSLALRGTCRRMRFEIGDKWLRYTLFDFGGPSIMFYKLAPLPIETISKIRHVRVYGDTHRYGLFEV